MDQKRDYYKQCWKKVKHRSWRCALAAIENRDMFNCTPYRCPHCYSYHIGKTSKTI